VAEERRDQRPEAAQEDERGVYIISVVAELLGMHPQTLRIYERKGLLQPARTAGNTRRYSERDLARLRTIQRLSQDEGVNLAGVRMIVEMQNRLEELRGQMEELRLRLEDAQGRAQQEVQQVHRQYRADIVPFAEMNRLRAQVEPTPYPEAAGNDERRGPIAVGPPGWTAAASPGRGEPHRPRNR
jgi:MerR family transcriptional regulator/heat shock protein HspR